MMKNSIAILFAASLLPLAAFAQDAAAPVTETISPAPCKKPLLPSKLRGADDTSDFDIKFENYKKCVSDYADAQGKLAKAHVKAANDAISDLNAFVAQVNDSQSNK